MKPPDDFIFIKDDTISRILKYKRNNYDLFEWDYSRWMLSRVNVGTKEARKYYDKSMNVYVRHGKD